MTINRKDELKSVFEDTINQIQNNTVLYDATKKSIEGTLHYAADNYPMIEQREPSKSEIIVTKHTTFNAAREFHKTYPDKKIAVLNFASATNPGGGVTRGSSAQEESLCRCSTLYPTLTQSAMWNQFYFVNRAEKNVLHTDACIYSPNIIVFKDDSYIPRMMPPKEWFSVDVISCAAPNLRNVVSNAYNPESGKAVHISPSELNLLHRQRAKHILTVAAANEVNILVLGAFGCGAFANDPRVVADATFEALDEFIKCQTIIDLAIIESKTKSRGPGCYGCGKHRMVLHHNYESESTSKSTDNALNYLNCDEPKRVAIYSRTLSNGSVLKDSFERQANHYKNLIREHPNWKLIDIYSDEVFVDGNPNQNHESFNNLISDCKSGKIDLIITKSISQFCQSLSDSLIVIKEISELPNPVSVIFEIEGICTIGDN